MEEVVLSIEEYNQLLQYKKDSEKLSKMEDYCKLLVKLNNNLKDDVKEGENIIDDLLFINRKITATNDLLVKKLTTKNTVLPSIVVRTREVVKEVVKNYDNPKFEGVLRYA